MTKWGRILRLYSQLSSRFDFLFPLTTLRVLLEFPELQFLYLTRVTAPTPHKVVKY